MFLKTQKCLSPAAKKTATNTQNKNIQQILIFFMFFKFMLLKFSAYLSHKYYRAFFLRSLLYAAESFYYSRHTGNRSTKVKWRKIYDLIRVKHMSQRKKKREKVFNENLENLILVFIHLLNCFCTFSFLHRLSLTLSFCHTNNE
jgi:hypothetical protein